MNITGRLTRDAEVKALPNDRKVVNFWIIVILPYSYSLIFLVHHFLCIKFYPQSECKAKSLLEGPLAYM